MVSKIGKPLLIFRSSLSVDEVKEGKITILHGEFIACGPDEKQSRDSNAEEAIWINPEKSRCLLYL